MQDNVQGIFVPARDPAAMAAAIRSLADHREALRRMSEAGRRRIAEQYTVERLAQRFAQIYDRLG
jgi:glycosyltransferase involved in cell wall biosynthesis